MKTFLKIALTLLVVIAVSQSASAIEVMRKINTATYIVFPVIDSAKGEPITSAAGLDSEFEEWDDDAAPTGGFTDCTNEATEIGATGMYYLLMATGEVDQDYTIVQVKSSTAGALTQVILIKTFTGDPNAMSTFNSSGDKVTIADSSAGDIARMGNSYPTDSANVKDILDTLKTYDGTIHSVAQAIKAVTDLFQFTATNFVQSDIQYIDATEAAATNLEKAFDGNTGSLSKLTLDQLFITPQGSNDPAVYAEGNGTGPGVEFKGGSDGAYGAYVHAGGSNTHGVYFLGTGTGRGLAVAGGTDGDGAIFAAGGGNNDGLVLQGAGTGKDLNATIDSTVFANSVYTAIVNFLMDADTANAAWDGDDATFGYWAAGRQLGGGGSGDSNTTAGVELGCRQAIVTYKLDHLLYAADGDDPVDNSVIALLAAIGGDWSTFDKTTESLEAIRNRGDAAWAAGGSGEQACSLFVYDTSGTDTPVEDVAITVQNSDQSSDVAVGKSTNSDGYVVYNLDASTSYVMLATKNPGYIFDNYSFTTGAGATHNDTASGYNITIGAPGNAALKRVYDYVYSGDADTLACAGLKFTATLIYPDSGFAPYDSATSVIVTVNPKPKYPNTSCMIYFDLYPNEGTSNAIIPHGTMWHIVGKDGAAIIYDKTVSLNGTSTERISTIHRGQVDR